MTQSLTALRSFAIAAFALIVVTFQPTPARASLSDCWDSIKGQAEAAMWAASKLDDIASCATKLAAPVPVGVGATGAAALLFAAGVFDTTDQCKGAVTGMMVKIFGEAINSTPGLIEALGALGIPKSTIDRIVDFASNEAASEIADLPGLSQILDYFTCGCTVVGGAIEAAGILKAVGKDTAECLGTLGEFAGKIVDAILPQAHPNYPNPVTVDVNKTCPDWAIIDPNIIDVYTYTSALLDNGQSYYPDGVPPRIDTCTCHKGQTIEWVDDSHVVCTCTGGQVLGASNACECQGGQVADSKGVCGCPYGQKMDPATQQCVSKCQSGGIYYDDTCHYHCEVAGQVYDEKSGQCSACGPGTAPFILGADTDQGTCKACDPGNKSAGDGAACEPICAQEWMEYREGKDAWRGAGCYNRCDSGLVWEASKTSEIGKTCQQCGANTQLNPNTNACEACAQGATWTMGHRFAEGDHAMCTCPKGMAPRDGVCQVCDEGSQYQETSNGGICAACPNGDCKATTLLRCTNNSVPDPATNYQTCKPCGETAYADGSICMLKPGQPPYIPPKTMASANPGDYQALSECGPGSERRGLDCVPQILDKTPALPKDLTLSCAAKGREYINNKQLPGQCIKCGQGKIANKSLTACVAIQLPVVKPKGERPAVRVETLEKPARPRSMAPDLDGIDATPSGRSSGGRPNAPGGGGASGGASRPGASGGGSGNSKPF